MRWRSPRKVTNLRGIGVWHRVWLRIYLRDLHTHTISHTRPHMCGTEDRRHALRIAIMLRGKADLVERYRSEGRCGKTPVESNISCTEVTERMRLLDCICSGQRGWLLLLAGKHANW